MKRERPINGFVRVGGRWLTREEWHLLFSAKRKRRKGQYMRYFSRWEGRHQSTKSLAARASRREGKVIVRETPYQ